MLSEVVWLIDIWYRNWQYIMLSFYLRMTDFYVHQLIYVINIKSCYEAKKSANSKTKVLQGQGASIELPPLYYIEGRHVLLSCPVLFCLTIWNEMRFFGYYPNSIILHLLWNAVTWKAKNLMKMYIQNFKVFKCYNIKIL